jgi:hypothetical protein
MRKSPVSLNDQELYEVYRHSIEAKSVIQTGDTTRYRVLPRIIAEEINACDLLPGKQISEHHVRKAIENVVEWQVLLNKLPMPQATAYEDQLQIDINKKNILIESQKIEIADLKKKLATYANYDDIVKQAKLKCAELSRVLHTPITHTSA